MRLSTVLAIISMVLAIMSVVQYRREQRYYGTSVEQRRRDLREGRD